MKKKRELKFENTLKMIADKLELRERGILFAFIIFVIIMSIAHPKFSTFNNYASILRESAFLGTAAIGMTFVISAGFIDLSVGAMSALIAAFTVMGCNQFGPLGLAMGLMVGAVCGLLNGCIIVFARIPSFIATLSTQLLFRALAYIVLHEKPVRCTYRWFTDIGNGSILGIPYPFLILMACTVVGVIIFRKMPFGKRVLAVGNSQAACRLSGINVKATIVGIYVLAGIFTAVNAILVCSRIWNAIGGMQDGYEFDIITAVVLGGTALEGGHGDVVNSVVAALFLAALVNVMTIFAVDPFWQLIIKGVILLWAFSMNGIKDLVQGKLRKRRLNAAVHSK